MIDDALQRAVHECLDGQTIRRARSLSGGCIADVRALELSDGSTIVAKCAPAHQTERLHEESVGLEAIAATNTVITAQPLGLHDHDTMAVLFTSYIQPPETGSTPDWHAFGRELAALHRTEQSAQYGFSIDNHCGATPQPNSWNDDWVEFNRVHRLGHQINRARNAGRINDTQHRTLHRVLDALDDLLPNTPRPSLIHGDLWSGNAVPTTNHRVAVIDPAPSVGDGWADIAMMRLFGGFSESCFNAYRESMDPIDDHDLRNRLLVYQLYHVLNHVNLFGGGYLDQALSLARQLTPN